MGHTPFFPDDVVNPEQVIDDPVSTYGAEEKDGEETGDGHVEYFHGFFVAGGECEVGETS